MWPHSNFTKIFGIRKLEGINEEWAHFQSNSNWTLTLTLKPDPNRYTNPNHNPTHSTDHTNPTELYTILAYVQ